jgi:hypothetical protein
MPDQRSELFDNLFGEKTAVHGNDRAGCVLRGRHAEERDGARNVFWLAPALECSAGGDALVMRTVGAAGRVDCGFDIAGLRPL